MPASKKQKQPKQVGSKAAIKARQAFAERSTRDSLKNAETHLAIRGLYTMTMVTATHMLTTDPWFRQYAIKQLVRDHRNELRRALFAAGDHARKTDAA
jgi:hypothetical protein